MQYTVSLKKNRDFRKLYAKGKSAVSPSMVLYCRKNRLGENRVGFSTGTKLGCAVVRNRIRRRLRAIYRTNEACVSPGYDLIVVARTRSVYTPYHELEKSFLRCAARLGLLREKTEANNP